jgi:hypothetical protein
VMRWAWRHVQPAGKHSVRRHCDYRGERGCNEQGNSNLACPRSCSCSPMWVGLRSIVFDSGGDNGVCRCLWRLSLPLTCVHTCSVGEGSTVDLPGTFTPCYPSFPPSFICLRPCTCSRPLSSSFMGGRGRLPWCGCVHQGCAVFAFVVYLSEDKPVK